jgi:hypothetical protein
LSSKISFTLQFSGSTGQQSQVAFIDCIMIFT